MKKLKLPISDKFPEQDRWLPMDEYIRFVNFCAKYFPRNRQSPADELAMRVNVPFSIK